MNCGYIDFNDAWEKIVNYAKKHKQVETLVRHVKNDIVCADNKAIVVISSSPKDEPTKRPLKREDFNMVWNKLVSNGRVSPNDIDPKLRGRRLIILALMVMSLNLKYNTKPNVTIYC